MKLIKYIFLGVILCSCTKEELITNPEKPNQVNLNRKMLRSVQSDDMSKSFSYNRDSTIHIIREERNGVFDSEKKFFYKNGRLDEIRYRNTFSKHDAIGILEYDNDLLVKVTTEKNNEIIAIEEYYYDNNKQLIKQIQKQEWNSDVNKQTRVIDINKVSGKNEIQLKYNGELKFIITYDEHISPYANIKGYSKYYTSHLHGITNNIVRFEKILKNGNSDTELTELVFDSSMKYLIENTKKGENQQLICKETFIYN